MTQQPTWLGREAPRYTSYPTAHHFSSQVGSSVQADWLCTLTPESDVSVYVHIPFCKELCWFCGCHTKMTKRYEPIAAYVQVLLAEIALVRAQVPAGVRLRNIHFGGGSPSLLSADDMIAIMRAITETFSLTPPCEIAIEIDPRTTSPENIALYAQLGFNRASLGVQDFDPKVQAAINREQSYALLDSTMRQLREVGIPAINADLIYGLPHQSLTRFATTLEQTIQLSPERLALFSYAHLPELKKHQRLIDEAALPSATIKLQLFELARDKLLRAGYVMVGFDHFAKQHDTMALAMQERSLKRNFQGYVTEQCDTIIGLGCSSISQYRQGYVQNSPRAVEYRERIARGELAGIRGHAFTGDDLARKQVIDTLMCFLEADVAEIAAQHELPRDYFAAELARLGSPEFTGLVQCKGSMVRLTTAHLMAIRVVAVAFDAYANHPTSRYSKVA